MTIPESQEGDLLSTRTTFRFGGQMGTGVLGLLGGESRIGMYGVAQTRTRLLGRRTLRPKQVLSECAIPTSRQNLLQIGYLNPLPVARAPGSKGHGCGQLQVNERAQGSGAYNFMNLDDRGDMGADSVEMDMLLRELWNEGEYSAIA